MKSLLKTLCLLCVLCGASLGFSLDREAFSITNYNLNLQIEPEQHRLGARGQITLRNDAPTPQKIAVLQISSSLDWRAIRVGGKMLQFVTQPYTSDIDHTGSLSEAIVTLPQEVASHATIDLDIAYEGVIVLDATRLTRLGTPEDTAKNSDWDRIDENFSGVRGAGYVAWYPIATESANLSENDDLAEVVGRWNARESLSSMSLMIASTKDCTILFSGTKDSFVVTPDKPVKIGAFSVTQRSGSVPTFVLASYKTIEVKHDSTVNFLPTNEAGAASYADVLGSLDPLQSAKGFLSLQVAQLPFSGATPFVSDYLLLTPMQRLTDEGRLTLVYALARQKAASPHPWINEGLAHFAQAYDIEQGHGRTAALDYLKGHRALLVDSQPPHNESDQTPSTPRRSLVETTDNMYLQSKAMCVWWMLRDMIGDASFGIALFSYQSSEDNEPTYMPRIIAAHTQRDLQWFFDDWVYHDRGLPDFKVESAFSASTPTKSSLLTITLDNLGTAGAEVPVTIKFIGGEVTKRIEVRAKSKATFRVETPAVPQEIRVNDGSVPESDMTNNTFKVGPPQS
ncbi:MAG TPA: hypothetical protein VJP02_10470 [Candidatus Sulfotelmatobacter sp.]|nr:hypothetical protein [Candidatus Sulfotelmatobacter sp.]